LTEQLAEAPEPASAQEAAEKVPVPLLVKLTLPVGVTGIAEVSVTVAVHADALPVATEAGAQLTPVLVARTAIVREKAADSSAGVEPAGLPEIVIVKIPVAAVASTVNVTREAAPPAVGVTGFVPNVTVTPAGTPLADNVTACAVPAVKVRVAVDVVKPGRRTVPKAGLRERL